MKIIQKEDLVYRLGRNAAENTALLKDADPGDWWFHIDGHPSGHCVIESIEMNEEIIQFAGGLVRDHSSLRGEETCRVVYCRVRDVTPTKEPGRVTVKNPQRATIKR